MQSAPPQSLALVNRTPCVEYGDGKVNVPRDGRNVCICADDKFGRRPTLVAESRKPPVGPDTWPWTTNSEKKTTMMATSAASEANFSTRRDARDMVKLLHSRAVSRARLFSTHVDRLDTAQSARLALRGEQMRLDERVPKRFFSPSNVSLEPRRTKSHSLQGAGNDLPS